MNLWEELGQVEVSIYCNIFILENQRQMTCTFVSDYQCGYTVFTHTKTTWKKRKAGQYELYTGQITGRII